MHWFTQWFDSESTRYVNCVINKLWQQGRYKPALKQHKLDRAGNTGSSRTALRTIRPHPFFSLYWLRDETPLYTYTHTHTPRCANRLFTLLLSHGQAVSRTAECVLAGRGALAAGRQICTAAGCAESQISRLWIMYLVLVFGGKWSRLHYSASWL